MINRNEKVSIIHYSMQMTFDSWQQTYFNILITLLVNGRNNCTGHKLSQEKKKDTKFYKVI